MKVGNRFEERDGYQKKLSNALLGIFFLLLCCYSLHTFEYYSMIEEGVSVIRMSGGILLPFITISLMPLAIFAAVSLVAVAMGFVPFAGRLRGATSTVVYICTGVCLFLLLIQPFATRYVMPKYGYHICQKLDGGLSIWHNDWVRNPDWCVRGKTREWVRAMALREAGGDVDPEGAQLKAKSRTKEEPLMPFSWTLLAFVFGAVLWGNELRFWDQFRNRHALLRWPMLVLAGLVAGLFTLVGAVAGYAMGGGKFWAVLLGVGFFVSWPLFGFLDERSSEQK